MGLSAEGLSHPMFGLVVALAETLREEVLPALGSREGRVHTRDGASGDVTFAIDELAELRMEEFLRSRAPDVAFYSEDRGMVMPRSRDSGGAGIDPADRPAWVLIVDPIDGTRPAMAALESACVSVAAARFGEGQPTMAEVEVGCVVEIKSGARFAAVRGGGVDPAPDLGTTTEIASMLWTYGLRGRPAVETVIALEGLLNESSVSGGTFDLGSATFDMTRILTGQMDAYVEPGPRIVAEIDGMRAEFERVGNGAVLNNSPYDLAAAALILQEAGAIVTDARGEPLDDRLLLGSGVAYQMSCVASANPLLHEQLITSLDQGIEKLRRRLG